MTLATAPKRPRTKPAETRREELVDAAQALFLDRGFDATSVDEIVRQADVAKGTFYFFLLLFQDQGRRAAGPARALLDAWIGAAVNGYLDEFALHDLVFHEFRPSSRSRQMQHDNPITVHLTALIAGGAKGGAWVSRSPRLTAAMLFSAFHGAVDDDIVSPAKMSRKRLIAEVRAFCRGALGPSAK